MNIAAKARAAAMGFEVKKDAVRQVQCGDWRLTLTVAAADMPVRVITAPPGVRYMLALVEIGDDEQPVSSTPSGVSRPGKQADESAPVEAGPREAPAAEGPGLPKREAPQRCPTAAPDKLVQWFGMACLELRFQKWLQGYVGLAGELDRDGAANCVRQLLGVKSRAEISTNEVARQKALDLMTDYDIHIGKHAKDYTA